MNYYSLRLLHTEDASRPVSMEFAARIQPQVALYGVIINTP